MAVWFFIGGDPLKWKRKIDDDGNPLGSCFARPYKVSAKKVITKKPTGSQKNGKAIGLSPIKMHNLQKKYGTCTCRPSTQFYSVQWFDLNANKLNRNHHEDDDL